MSRKDLPPINRDAVEKAAEAIYRAQIDRARENIDSIDFAANEMPELFARLKNESETAQILIFASYLEDRVSLLLKARMQHLDSQNAEEALFGGNGPLSTFGNRTTLAYQLGWLSETQKNKLIAFRKIRNEFAHSAFKVSLSDQKISDLLSSVDYDLPQFLAPIRESFDKDREECPLIEDEDIAEAEKYLCNLAILSKETFEDLLVLPSAQAFQVEPVHVVRSFDTCPNHVQELNRNLARSILILLLKPGYTFEEEW